MGGEEGQNGTELTQDLRTTLPVFRDGRSSSVGPSPPSCLGRCGGPFTSPRQPVGTSHCRHDSRPELGGRPGPGVCPTTAPLGTYPTSRTPSVSDEFRSMCKRYYGHFYSDDPVRTHKYSSSPQFEVYLISGLHVCDSKGVRRP